MQTAALIGLALLIIGAGLAYGAMHSDQHIETGDGEGLFLGLAAIGFVGLGAVVEIATALFALVAG